MNSDAWEFSSDSETWRGNFGSLGLIYCCVAGPPSGPWMRARMSLLWPACYLSPAGERESLAQGTNGASQEGPACGGIPLANGLSSLGEEGISGPVVQHGRCFPCWSPVIRVFLISSCCHYSRAHLVLLATFTFDVRWERANLVHLLLLVWDIGKFWALAAFLGWKCLQDVLYPCCPSSPNISNQFTFLFLRFRVVSWLSLELLSGFLFALSRE